jgi:peptide/nickel transport system ATP-binding protein
MTTPQTDGANDAPLLEISNLNVSYYTRKGEVPAVLDFNLTLRAGQSVGLVGESGCGKSTVSLAIMRYMGNNGAITGGVVKFMGRDMATMSEEELRDLRGSKIAMIYQEPFAALNPCLTIGEQLTEVPMTHDGASAAEAKALAAQILADVNLPDPDRILQSYPHQLSGGQQQRVVIGMALLSNPKLLLLDEPTTALDVTVEAAILDVIQKISKKYGTAMIYVSHNMGLILKTCERVAVMYSGQIMEEGAVGEIFRNPRHPYTRGLFGCIPNMTADKNSRPLLPIRGQLPLATDRPRGCYFGPRCDFFKEEQCGQSLIPIASAGDGGHLARCSRWQEIDWDTYAPKAQKREPIQLGDAIVRASNMKKHYELPSTGMFGGETRKVKAVQDLSFEVREKQIVAIVGESGCGKSTFAKVLMGLESGSGGDLVMGDEDLAAMPVEARNKDLISAVQMVFQNPNDTLNPTHTVGQQIGRSIRKLGAESAQEVEQKVERLLDLVKLPRSYKNYKPSQLSGGQKQRIGIARAFAGQSRLIVADEPVSALDVSVQAAVIDLLLDIQATNDTTLLFISHDLSLVRYLADKIVVMYLGRIMEQGATKDIFSPPYHPYTEALLSAVPVADHRVEKKEVILEGELPSPLNPPSGCPFSTRCQHKVGKICEEQLPPLRAFDDGHEIYCHVEKADLEKMRPVFRLQEEPAAAPASQPAA